MRLFVLTVLLVPCFSLHTTRHFLHLSDDGKSVHQDIIYDEKENTVLVIVGDVSMYENTITTVNLHDFDTGYVAFKDIKHRICSLSKVPIPIPTPEIYSQGVSNETLRFIGRYDPTPLTYSKIHEIAGSKIADFCQDYITFFRTLTLTKKNKRNVSQPEQQQPNTPCDHNCVICVVSSDLTELNDSINFG